MEARAKKEIVESAVTEAQSNEAESRPPSNPVALIDLSSSDSDSDEEDERAGVGSEKSRDLRDDYVNGGPSKKRKLENGVGMALPLGFLDPLPPDETPMLLLEPDVVHTPFPILQSCRQFWKAGDYDREEVADSTDFSVGMDHVRVHPKFLHSNATSHKWALGAFAELLDNSLDEVCYGATFVNVDVLTNKKDGTKMLLVEDNGGGMNPDKMRQCMSLGYSAKSKLANTIGQYGNGFKTSTMRLGADVIVFSRCLGKDDKRPTQSIGMLSYTFLRTTGKEDIVVPMLDYEKRGQAWIKMIRSSSVDWNKNFDTIVQWSPYLSEADLLQQFNLMTDHGTRIVIYNLWDDDQGELELDFGADKHDIQVRGVSRDEKKIEMAKQFPNSRHFLTYRHSLRSYASILYLRLPHNFRIILRGKDIAHHNIVNDMMLKQEITYRPQPGADGVLKEPNMVAVVTIGFVKDAKGHIDVQGFNVYHKNRLIKPFWRVWNAAGSDGRGVIGVLEANFVEPAHDKQGFERTTVLARLEQRLIQMQKQYWSTYCHKIGYAPRRNKKHISAGQDKESSPEELPQPSSRRLRKDMSPISTPFYGKAQDSTNLQNTNKSHSRSSHKSMGKGSMSPVVSVKVGDIKHVNGNISSSEKMRMEGAEKIAKKRSTQQSRLHTGDETYSDIEGIQTEGNVNRSDVSRPLPAQNIQKGNNHLAVPSSPNLVANGTEKQHAFKGVNRIATRSQLQEAETTCNGDKANLEDPDAVTSKRLKDENRVLKGRIKELEDTVTHELQYERDRNRSLREKLEAAEKRLEEANKEQEALIDIFSEERNRRDKEEENLRNKLKESSVTIQELLNRLSIGNPHVKTEG